MIMTILKISISDKSIYDRTTFKNNNKTTDLFFIKSSGFQEYSANLKIINGEEEFYNIDLKLLNTEYNGFMIKVTGIICNWYINILEKTCEEKVNYSFSSFLLVDERNEDIESIYNTVGKYRVVISPENVVIKEKIKIKNIPFFEISRTDYDFLLKYDISYYQEGKSLILAEINFNGISNFIKSISKVLEILFLIIIGIFVLFFIFWIYFNYLKMKNFRIQTQKYYKHLPFILLILLSGYYLKIRKTLYGFDEISILYLFVELLTSLCGIIYNTFYWILLILVCHGFTVFDYENSKNFFFYFVFIYLTFLSDIIINNMISSKEIGIFSLEFMKNIFFFLFYQLNAFFQTRLTLKNVNLSHIKYLSSYGEDSINNFLKCAIIKYNQIKRNIILITFHIILYIVGNGLISVYMESGITCIHIFYNCFLNTLFLIFVLINLRTRKILHIYDGINFEFSDLNNIIYKSQISKKRIYLNPIFWNNINNIIMNSNNSKLNIHNIDVEDFDYIIINNPFLNNLETEKISILSTAASNFQDSFENFKTNNMVFPEEKILSNSLMGKIISNSL